SSSSVFRIGVGNNPIRRARISNIMITRGGVGMHFMSGFPDDQSGVDISDIHFRHISAYDLGMPFYFHNLLPLSSKKTSNVSISDYYAEVYANGIISGTGNSRPVDILLRDVELKFKPSPVHPVPFPDSALCIELTDNVRLRNVRIDLSEADSGVTKKLTTVDCQGFETDDYGSTGD
ncbi:MAG: hypothetical protein PHV59_10665, partial [Victivallales bacterium]|nr:hypothetical protein [Victivallales bacterium]